MTGRLDAVLLDRDGTINVKAAAGGYITAPDQLQLLPGAAEAIRALNHARIPMVVVTNQRAIALGLMSEADLAAVHLRLHALLRERGAAVNAILHCPHQRGTCGCRKPGPLLLLRARTLLHLQTLRHTVMIGDSASDVQAGRAAGARTVLLAADDATATAETDTAPSLLHAVRAQLTAVTPRSRRADVGCDLGKARELPVVL